MCIAGTGVTLGTVPTLYGEEVRIRVGAFDGDTLMGALPVRVTGVPFGLAAIRVGVSVGDTLVGPRVVLPIGAPFEPDKGTSMGAKDGLFVSLNDDGFFVCSLSPAVVGAPLKWVGNSDPSVED
jgi:hypothetical protein